MLPKSCRFQYILQRDIEKLIKEMMQINERNDEIFSISANETHVQRSTLTSLSGFLEAVQCAYFVERKYLAADLKVCNFIKKRLQHTFLYIFQKF